MLAHSAEALCPVGFQRWPFKFQLPVGCSSSCDVPHGRVYYTVKAEIVKKGFNKKAKAPFVVVQRMDLDAPQFQVGEQEDGGGEQGLAM